MTTLMRKKSRKKSTVTPSIAEVANVPKSAVSEKPEENKDMPNLIKSKETSIGRNEGSAKDANNAREEM